MAKFTKAFLAEQEVLRKTGCEIKKIFIGDARLQIESSDIDKSSADCFSYLKWDIYSRHSKILKSAELVKATEAMKDLLTDHFASCTNSGDIMDADNLNLNGFSMHIPPMVFGHDMIILRCRNGALAIDAQDALFCWAAKVFPNTIHHLQLLYIINDI